MDRRRIVILGAAGRDFHDFLVLYRDDPAVEVMLAYRDLSHAEAVHLASRARYEYREAQSPGLGERVDAFLAERGLGTSRATGG